MDEASKHSVDKRKPRSTWTGAQGGWWASDGLGKIPPLGVRPVKIVVVAIRV